VLPITNKTIRDASAAEAPATKPGDPAAESHGGWRLSAFVSNLRGHGAVKPAVAPVETPGRDLSPAARIAEQLVEQCSDEVVLLHHRKTPRVKPHIDHLAICRSGVWIIHTRRNQGRVATRKPMFGDPKLTIGGRERTDLLMNLERQVSYVEAALLKTAPDVPVRSALCFVDTEAPLIRMLYLGSYLFFGAPALVKHLNSEGSCDATQIQALATVLEAKFPPA
jgi:hypothetical protein